MAAARDADVGAAFELVIEALANAKTVINEKGAKAFRESSHFEVDSLNSKAKRIQDFMKRVGELQDEWFSVVDVNDLTEERAEMAPSAQTAASSLLDLSMNYEGAVAKAKYGPRTVTLLEGSTVRRPLLESLSDTLRELRQRCEKDGRLVEAPGAPAFLKLTNSLTFRSPSAAAKFVAGCSISGNIYWRVEPSGSPLGSYLRR